MIFDMNIKLEGIDEEFLEDFDELIEDTRVEYFLINPNNIDELKKSQELCREYIRFKYTTPTELRELRDENCVAIKIKDISELDLIEDMPIVIDSDKLSDELIDSINKTNTRGVVIDAKESDTKLPNFAYSISHKSLKSWSKKGITDIDYNQLALQSDYPDYSYEELIDVHLKEISDLTFRAEQIIASSGTRTLLKTFGLL